MIVLTPDRGTPEWRAAHRCRVGASDVPAILAGRGRKVYQKLVDRLVLDFEGVENHVVEHPDSWHEEHEDEIKFAVSRYGNLTGETLERVGCVQHPKMTWLVASPHALVGETGCVHVRTRAHLRTWRERHTELSRVEFARVQTVMCVCERAWCDVVDYWHGGDVERIARQRVDVDAKFFTEDVLPRAAVLWQDVASRRAERAA